MLHSYISLSSSVSPYLMSLWASLGWRLVFPSAFVFCVWYVTYVACNVTEDDCGGWVRKDWAEETQVCCVLICPRVSLNIGHCGHLSLSVFYTHAILLNRMKVEDTHHKSAFSLMAIFLSPFTHISRSRSGDRVVCKKTY